MERVVNVNDLSIEDLMRLIEEKKLVKKQKITCNDLDNLIKMKPFIESDPSKVHFKHIATNVSSTSFALNDHDYVNATNITYLKDDNILSLLQSNTNIEVRVGNEFKPLSDSNFTSSRYDLGSASLDLNSLKDELTDLDKNLSPLELIEIRTGKFDLGIFCNEIYDDKFKLTDSKVIKISNGTSSVEVGETVNSDPIDNNGVPDTLMSTVKDSFGNVYSITKNIALSEVDDYLNLEKNLPPSNNGVQLDFKAKQSTPSVISSDSDVKYFKGFLIFNSYLNVTGKASDYYQTTMIWINQPTLITTTITNAIYTIKIGDFIDIIMNFSSDIPTGRLCIKLPDNCDKKQICLPVKSKFFNVNFDGSVITLKEIIVSKLN